MTNGPSDVLDAERFLDPLVADVREEELDVGATEVAADEHDPIRLRRTDLSDLSVEVDSLHLEAIASLDRRQGFARLAVAAERPGANINAILDDAHRDPLSGNAVLSGIPISLQPR